MASKYRAKKVEYDGIVFDSKKERDRYVQLKILEEAGVVKDLKLQVKFRLIPAQRIDGKVVERECTYIADFVYQELGEDGNWHTVVEDVKGYRQSTAYSIFSIKRKLMMANYGIRIREV